MFIQAAKNLLCALEEAMTSGETRGTAVICAASAMHPISTVTAMVEAFKTDQHEEQWSDDELEQESGAIDED